MVKKIKELNGTLDLDGTFQSLIIEGIKTAKSISDPKEKAVIFASFAQAIAQTGLVKDLEFDFTGDNEDNSDDEAPKTNKKSTTKKTTAKKNTDKETVPSSKNKKNDKKKTTGKKKTEPEEIDADDLAEEDEWTDELQEKMAPYIMKLEKYIKDFGENDINAGVEVFTEGEKKDWSDLTPAEIIPFLTFIEVEIAKADEAGEEDDDEEDINEDGDEEDTDEDDEEDTDDDEDDEDE